MDHDRKFEWDTRTQYIMAMLCQTISTTTFMFLPLLALTNGATGCLIGYTLVYLLLGIPLLYMEFIISQFTARDCLQVWRTRPCLSHIGYIQIFFQVFFVLYNHTVVAFIIHYFLISFEDPVPYFICGKWANRDCGILKTNYTVNQDCIKNGDEGYTYCKYLYKTFPEYQYWRNQILGKNQTHLFIAWRVCFASALACGLVFLACFRRKQSLKWFLGTLTIFPIIGYMIIMIGSMMQKGVVTWYSESIDSDFEVFKNNYSISRIIQEVLFSLNIGTGLSFNLGASTSFRAPLYSNIVTTVAVCTVFSIFAVCTIALMPCPFSQVYGILPSTFMKYEMALVFEKIPSLLKEYESYKSYLILIYSSNTVLGLSTNIMMIQHGLEMMAQRYKIISNYPGFSCFICMAILFFITIPLLGNKGVYTVFNYRTYLQLTSTFLIVVECCVFVLWYGLENFSEDVHFMQGIRPGCFLKMVWILSSVIVACVYFQELYLQYTAYNPNNWAAFFGWCTTVFMMAWTVLLTLARLAVAGVRKRFRKEIAVDQSWGPRNLVLLRSRAMFTAQAMTKEYIYRQYHLQAGIMARQKTSNIRKPLVYNE